MMVQCIKQQAVIEILRSLRRDMIVKTPKKILVVEDEESLRKDIIDMLSFEGFEVTGA